jgi:uncharacterized protein with HEPN domain
LPQRLARPALQAILEAINGIQAAIAGKTLDDYSGDWLLKHGVERGIEIISEAARRLPADLRSKRSDIPWKQIFAIGNIIRHNYDEIADRIIFDLVERDLPILKVAISSLESELDEPC